MYLIESNQVSLCVTPNHRMYVSSRSGEYKIELAEDILGKRKYYKKNVDSIETIKDTRNFVYNNMNEITHFKCSDTIIEINDWLLFFGIWIAEGHVGKNNNYIVFAAHKQRVKDMLIKISQNQNWKYTTTKDHSNAIERDIFNFINKPVKEVLVPINLGAVNKFLPKWVWNLSPILCKKLIEGMMLGDGHTMENGTRRYDTSSKQLADDFQRLCLHAGFATNISVKYMAGKEALVKTGKSANLTCDAYRMSIIETQVEPIVNKNIQLGKQQDKMIDYTGKVFCCTVKGEGVIYVRRNKIPVWSGNSRRKFMPKSF